MALTPTSTEEISTKYSHKKQLILIVHQSSYFNVREAEFLNTDKKQSVKTVCQQNAV